jgi:hypothetical protein
LQFWAWNFLSLAHTKDSNKRTWTRKLLITRWNSLRYTNTFETYLNHVDWDNWPIHTRANLTWDFCCSWCFPSKLVARTFVESSLDTKYTFRNQKSTLAKQGCGWHCQLDLGTYQTM